MSRALGQPGEWSLELSDMWQKTFNKLPLPLQKLVSLNLYLLGEAHRSGQLDIENIQTIADFGAGIGGPTFALTAITEDVEAFEMQKTFANRNELQTLDSVLEILRKAEVNYSSISGLSIDGKEISPAVIIQKSEIGKL